MARGDVFTLLVMGGAFFVVGLIGVFWGSKEERNYTDAISRRSDVREFLTHWPLRPEAVALRIGGWIAISVGVVLAAIGGAIWYWG